MAHRARDGRRVLRALPDPPDRDRLLQDGGPRVAGGLSQQQRHDRDRHFVHLLAMGGASSALYLIHPIAIGFFKTVGRVWPVVYPNNSGMTVIGILFTCSLIALAVYYRIEKPLLAFLRRRLAGARQPVAVGAAPVAAPATPPPPSQPLVP